MTSPADDIYTEPSPIDANTLACLGPLAPLAGVWEGEGGVDVAPKAAGPRTQPYHERIELQPIDPQANGPPPGVLPSWSHHRLVATVVETRSRHG